MRFLAFIAVLLSASCASQHEHPVAFTSDGCSSSPDGTLTDPQHWKQACTIHDYRYWRGGTPKQRLDADRELRDNIAATGNPLCAQLYLLGVRLGGSAWFPTSYRWGYAWAWPRGYSHLSTEEQAALDSLEPIQPKPSAL
jgi:hypothetical protein